MTEQTRVPQPPSLAAVKQARPPVRDVNAERKKSLTALEHVAIFISDHVGTPGFFLIIVFWTIFWLLWNTTAPLKLRFDPQPAFVIWLFVSNVLQIFLMPLLLVASNLQSRHAEFRAESDYEVNLKAEDEVEAILHHLEYQNSLILAMMEKLGIKEEDALQLMKSEAPVEGDGPTA